MLSTHQIDQVFKEDENYLGTYPMNKLPNLPKTFPKRIIINTDPANKVGDHWIALVLTYKKVFYFDSFGIKMINEEIKNFLLPKYKSVIFNNLCIQHITSDKCGAFCIYFVKSVHNLKSYYKFLSNFSTNNLKINDKIIMNKVKYMF